MKQPTTPYSKSLNMKINREFLLSQGWTLNEEYPLFETYKKDDLVCSIGLYGDFSVYQLHWLNRTPEHGFSTINPNLTEEDYFTILRLLNVAPTTSK